MDQKRIDLHAWAPRRFPASGLCWSLLLKGWSRKYCHWVTIIEAHGQNPLSRNPNRAPDKYPMNHHPGAAVSLGSANSRKDGALYLASSHPDAIGQLSPFLVRPPSHCCSSVILSPGSPEIHSTSNQMLLLQGRQPKQPNRYLMILPAQQYSSFFVFVFVFVFAS